MPVEAVFLDAGRTLLHEVPSRAGIYADAARRRGVSISDERMALLMDHAHDALPREIDGAFRYTDPWFEAFIARIFGEGLGLAPQAVAEISRQLFARFETASSFRLYHGASALFSDLRRRGLVLGVVSNWSERLPALLAALGIAERFDFALASSLARAEKPEPAIFHAALERAGVPPERAVHAGDHPERDGLGAVRAGLRACLVDHEGRLAEAPEGIPVVGSLPELRRHILSLP